MARQAIKKGFRLPPVEPGSWEGEIFGGGSVSLGQSVQPGPPPLSVEFSYILLPASLFKEGGGFRWPGVVMIMVPTPMRPEMPDAGSPLASKELPSLSLALEVCRAQFSDLLRMLEGQRCKGLNFSIEAASRKNCWPVRSWGVAAKLN